MAALQCPAQAQNRLCHVRQLVAQRRPHCVGGTTEKVAVNFWFAARCAQAKLYNAHIYIHRYIHTCIHTCIHTYRHADRHTYIHTYRHTYIYTHTCVHRFLHKYAARAHKVCNKLCIHILIFVYVCVCILFTHRRVGRGRPARTPRPWNKITILHLARTLPLILFDRLVQKPCAGATRPFRRKRGLSRNRPRSFLS